MCVYKLEISSFERNSVRFTLDVNYIICVNFLVECLHFNRKACSRNFHKNTTGRKKIKKINNSNRFLTSTLVYGLGRRRRDVPTGDLSAPRRVHFRLSFGFRTPMIVGTGRGHGGASDSKRNRIEMFTGNELVPFTGTPGGVRINRD